MSDNKNPAKPTENSEKFKPQNVQDDDSNSNVKHGKNGPDTSRGAEHHLQRKSMNRP